MQSVLKIQWINSGLQMISSGADGLLKLWNLGKSENIATYNNHDEGKIWALIYNEDEKRIYSGGSDASLLEWDDITQEVENVEYEKMKKEVAEEQALVNLRHEGKPKDAAILAFKLGKNEEFITYIENLLELGTESKEKDPIEELLNDQKEFSELFNERSAGIIEKPKNETIKEIINEAAKIDLGRLMDIIKDCNTNSYHALLSQTVLYYIIENTDIEKLKEIAKRKVEKGKIHNKKDKEKDLIEIIDILLAYTERHASRVDKFIKFSCFIDYISQKMNILTDNQ